MVDMGIILCENILKHLDEARPEESRLEVIYRACTEVAGAILTAIATTVVSFLPVFSLEAAEGKLFKPLAYTKTFALVSSVVVALLIIPPIAHLLFTGKIRRQAIRVGLSLATFVVGIWVAFRFNFPLGIGMALFGFGFGIVMPTVTDTIMAAVPVDEAGIGSSMNDTSRELGFALGVAILGSIVTSIYRSDVTEGLANVASSEVVTGVAESLGALGQIASLLPAEVASAVTIVANQAFVDAMRIGVLAGIGIVGLSIAIALLTMPGKMRAGQAELDAGDADGDLMPSAIASVPLSGD